MAKLTPLPPIEVQEALENEFARGLSNMNRPAPPIPSELYAFQKTAALLAEQLMEAAQTHLTKADNMLKQIQAINAKLIEGMDAKAAEFRAQEAAGSAMYDGVLKLIDEFHAAVQKEPRPENGRGS